MYVFEDKAPEMKYRWRERSPASPITSSPAAIAQFISNVLPPQYIHNKTFCLRRFSNLFYNMFSFSALPVLICNHSRPLKILHALPMIPMVRAYGANIFQCSFC